MDVQDAARAIVLRRIIECYRATDQDDLHQGINFVYQDLSTHINGMTDAAANLEVDAHLPQRAH